ncbi:MAG: pyridoxal phosphate-dependent aminotransferase [Anaerolineales bacterium]|nr:pyridoxal phosphate-dependent aminotransferase [Anaerolineales bacterium]
MQFTDRVTPLRPEGAYAVLARAQALEAQGRRIIHLEIGQPDFPTPEHVSAAGIQAIRNGKTKYNPPAGIRPLREAIAEYAGRQRSLTFEPERVVIGPGSKPGLFFPTLALVAPGDEVLYPDPGFPTYEAMIRVAGGVPVPVPLREDHQFSLDLEAFDRLLSPRTRLIILNSPANPTGGIIPLADLEHIAARAQEYNCWVLSDEIYSRLTYDGVVAHSIAELPGMLERTVIVDGFSKTYAMTGWRLGYMIAPLALAERLELLLTHAIGCTATFTQYAGLEALTGPQDFVEQMKSEYQRRLDRMLELVNSIPGLHAQTPQGAFYLFPNVKSYGLSSREIAARLIEEAGVAVLPGSDFGSGGEGYLRLVYAVSMETIEEGMAKIKTWFEAQKRQPNI